MIASTLPSRADAALRAHIDAACARIAPAWPLDRMIAVNPYWGWTDRPIRDAAAELAAVAGAPMLMPRSWYRRQLVEGRITQDSVERALQRLGIRASAQDVIRAVQDDAAPLPHHPLVSELRDAQRNPARQMLWREFIAQQIGQACEAYFDTTQAPWQPHREQGLYALWRELAMADAGPRLVLGESGLPAAIAELPDAPEALIADALDTLAVPRQSRTAYLTALLLSVVGWASVASHRRWEARLRSDDDETIVELLALRLAWELVLYRTATASDLPARWTQERRQWQDATGAIAPQLETEWILQRALELHYHERLAGALAWHPTLRHADSGPAAPATIAAQTVFCIDVRSEVLRRHLEDCESGVQTLGFAGFFGIPLTYRPPVGRERPQLPGLLAATVIAEDADASLERRRAAQAQRQTTRAYWDRLADTAPGGFAMVEATGLGAALRMIAASFEPTRRDGDPLRAGLDAAAGIDASGAATSAFASPRLARHSDGSALSDEDRAAIAENILRGMSLTAGFAELVAFVGHGAVVTNNPQAAGLACGACGGQSGEVNARVAAALLNDAAVRAGLRARGIEIPARTRFVGGLHDTVSDDVLLFPDAETERSHTLALTQLKAAFARAARRTRLERSALLGVEHETPAALAEALRLRGADWSELRPEWGLARNAAFIAAPRSRTRALDLKGRAFLHEYDCTRDREHRTLELILTAPMVVAHWINFQYWASTVDPSRFGSGDKTRHNVVGGHLGVYEGAGGDLRIGLAQQSVHDGHRFIHEPLRLGVYVEASAEAIDAVLDKHAKVRALVEHEWLYLYRIDPVDSGVSQRSASGWLRIAEGNRAHW